MSNDQSPEQSDVDIIDASPTKDFFIYMLVKDIDLTSAISDLIDNCIDGAKQLRGNASYTGLFVNLEIDKSHFKISDNCGGIEINIAKNYAFRFGRSSGSPLSDYAIGRFGVGMKRAIFKMGAFFKIESITENSKFIVEQDIEEWVQRHDESGKEKWDFNFNYLKSDYQLKDGEFPGTEILVTNLYEGVSDEFSLENYINRLRHDLSSDHQMSIHRGLKISLNGIPLKEPNINLAKSEYIIPAYKCLKRNEDKVSIKIYAGIIKPENPQARLEPSEAGWNVFCNERLVLNSDQTSVTGWGRIINGNPSFHNDYALFRGYTFFESKHPDLLPWNTTKNGIDADLRMYRSIRQEMAKLMKPITKFLRQLAKEKREKEDDSELSSLERVLFESEAASLYSITEENNFELKILEEDKDEKEKTNNIQYSKPESEVARVKASLGVQKLKEVGEKTFEYYLEMECEDE